MVSAALQALGYEVSTVHNATAEQMLKAIDILAEKDHTHCDSVVFYFSGHGNTDSIMSADEEIIRIDDDIVAAFRTDLLRSKKTKKSLQGKPRLFFFV